jgi:hypothetical protein
MKRIYLLDGSLHSHEALQLLEQKSLAVEPVTVSGPEMAELFHQAGIRELPTLVWDSGRYEGLEQIRSFVEH